MLPYAASFVGALARKVIMAKLLLCWLIASGIVSFALGFILGKRDKCDGR